MSLPFDRSAGRRRLRALDTASSPVGGGARTARRLIDAMARRPRPATLLAATAAAVVGFVLAGPVAATIAAVYAAVAVTVVGLRRRAAVDVAAFERAYAAVGTVAADLRAGGDPPDVLARVAPALRASGSAEALAHRVDAAVRVADDTGAPLAALLDRLESDSRTVARARASAAAQAAGAHATAWLLAGLPAAGLALGAGIGANPIHVLLHTPLGAACAGGAVVFQIAGLAWTQRLATSIRDAA
jgi:tight adherence protein B